MRIPQIDKDDAVSLHEQVAAEIRRAIADGEAREGERLPPAIDLAAVLGVNTPRHKALAYGASAFFPAVVGGLFFFKSGIIEPSGAFDLTLSIEAIVMVMLGGYGTVTGPLVGAFLYEELRGFLLTSPSVSQLQLVIAGALLLAMVLFAPGGLMGFVLQRWPRLRGILQ